MWIGDHPDDIGTLNGSTSGLGNLDGRRRVCPDGNGGFIVTPLAAQNGDHAEFRFFKDPPNSVSLAGPNFGMASFMMGDAVFTGSVTAETVVMQNQEPPYPGADIAAKMSFNGVDISADNILIASQDNDEVPGNIDLQLNFQGGGLTALEMLSINGRGTQLNMNGSVLNADTMDFFGPGLGSGDLEVNLTGVTGITQKLTQIAYEETSRVELNIEGGSSLDWAKNADTTTIGHSGDVSMTLQGASTLNTNGTFLAFQETSSVDIEIENSKWETDLLAAGGFGEIEITAKDGSELKSSEVSLGHFNNQQFNHTTEVLLRDSKWDISNFLNVGAVGEASLKLEDESAVDVKGLVIISDFENSYGKLEIQSDSALKAAQSLEVGRNSFGDMLITDGGQVITEGDGFVGTFQKGDGHVEISGDGSLWDVKGNLNIGNGLPAGPIDGVNGKGEVIVKDGGELRIGELKELRIGRREGSEGQLTLSGEDTKLSGGTGLNQGMSIGIDGKGSVLMENGFDLDAEGLVVTLGQNASGAGDMIVKDAGTEVHLSEMTVGKIGQGSLSILGGAKATLEEGLTIADKSEEELAGKVIVQGENSTLDVKGDVIVGNEGFGELTLKDHAKGVFNDGEIILGNEVASQGKLTISGEGVSIEGDSELRIGNKGEGILEISNGASFELESAELGKTDSSAADIFVKGQNSKLEIKHEVTLSENGGFSQIHVQGGGKLTTGAEASDAELMILGKNQNSQGRVHVDGEGSEWVSSSKLRVGDEGDGLIFINEGGKLKAEKDLTLGHDQGSSGLISMNIGQDNAPELYYETLNVGLGGEGDISAFFNAKLIGADNSSRVILGGEENGSKGRGNMTIAEDSEWLMNGSLGLTVGQFGEGALNIQTGGLVKMKENAELALGANQGASGKVVVDDGSDELGAFKPSTLLTGNQVLIGVEGSGELEIKNGAEVKAAGNASNLQTHVGTAANSSGKVTVTGEDSLWETGNLNLGGEGSAELNASGKSLIESKDVQILGNSSHTTSVLMNDAKWMMDKLQIGKNSSVDLSGRSKIIVESGANVAARIEGESGAAAAVKLSGESALELNQFALSVGNNGSIELDRSSIVTQDDVTVSGGSGAERAHISLDNESILHLKSNGKLRIGNGGAVAVLNGSVVGGKEILVSDLGGVGDLLVGSGSEVIADKIVVGSGQGTMTTTGGGAVHAENEMQIKGQGVVNALGGSVTVGSDNAPGTNGRVEVRSGGKLSGNGTIIGDLFVQGVVADIFGTGGIVKPGNSPGTLTVDGDFIMEDMAVLELEIGGTDAGFFDFLDISGQAVFKPGSIIELKFIDSFAPREGDYFSFIEADKGLVFIPEMLKINVSGLLPGFAFSPDFSDGKFSITALNDGVVVPEPGTLMLAVLGIAGLGFTKRNP